MHAVASEVGRGSESRGPVWDEGEAAVTGVKVNWALPSRATFCPTIGKKVGKRVPFQAGVARHPGEVQLGESAVRDERGPEFPNGSDERPVCVGNESPYKAPDRVLTVGKDMKGIGAVEGGKEGEEGEADAHRPQLGEVVGVGAEEDGVVKEGGAGSFDVKGCA